MLLATWYLYTYTTAYPICTDIKFVHRAISEVFAFENLIRATHKHSIDRKGIGRITLILLKCKSWDNPRRGSDYFSIHH